MAIDITITAPLPPRGKGRPRSAVCGGHARVFTPEETRRWEAQLASLAAEQIPAEPLGGALRVDILAAAPRPKALLQRYAKARPGGYGDGTWKHPVGLLWRPAKPDGDNVRKAVLDALKVFWRDDAQVVRGDTLSVYAEATGRPRVVVRIRDMVGDPAEIAFCLGVVL